MHPNLQATIGFIVIAAALIAIVGYANPPPPTDRHWIAPGKAPGAGVTMHSERG